MILKLRTGFNKYGTSWRLLDRVKKIDYTYTDEPKELPAGTVFINNHPNVPDRGVTEICIVYENGLGEMFYTDDMVYIMNDNGKTCDSINV